MRTNFEEPNIQLISGYSDSGRGPGPRGVMISSGVGRYAFGVMVGQWTGTREEGMVRGRSNDAAKVIHASSSNKGTRTRMDTLPSLMSPTSTIHGYVQTHARASSSSSVTGYEREREHDLSPRWTVAAGDDSHN